MYATIPVYYPSLEEAARKDEAALWCDSYNNVLPQLHSG